MDIKEKIRTIPHFPKQGIMFRDITTLLKDPDGFHHVILHLAERYSRMDIDVVAGIESRGFILGGAVAALLKKGFVPIRKKGKLPGKVVRYEYELEYGKDIIEVHEDAIRKGDRVLLIDDLVATGGTAGAAIKLIEQLGGNVIEAAFVIDLPDLKGRERILPTPSYAMVAFEGE
ncbi:adenine phosphoribosyltransferase [Candidatus Woesearchaeota archaeon]|nr:adenine phosphoribosyltransferase [Candidatus Woesearchaeota archaeon]